MSEVRRTTPPPQPVVYHSLTRASSFPAVVSLWDAVTKTYSHVKRSNRLVSSALTVVEECAIAVAERGKPVVLEKFSAQLSYIDGLVCRGLDKLEGLYHDVAKKQLHGVVADATQFARVSYANAKECGRAKVSFQCSNS